MFTQLIELLLLTFVSFTILFVMRKIARKVGLVDKPNVRKLHQGSIPLVGGISICFSLLYFLFYNPTIIPNAGLYASCIILLVVIGALDDKFDISYKFRFFIQALISIGMMYLGGIELNTLGNIFGLGNVTLGNFGYLITIFGVIAAINAFNMVDGIDGLLGGLSIVTFAGLGFLLSLAGQYNLAYMCVVLIAVILPYITLNLGLFGRKRKVFMGDAGSMLIGFTVIWFLLLSSQNGTHSALRPVTSLWLIALPLMDMAAIMIRRILRGDSPFKPDREHLHHIFQRFGLTSIQTLSVIFLISLSFAAFGIYGEIERIPEVIMFLSFIVCFLLYMVFLSHQSKISSFLKRRIERKKA